LIPSIIYYSPILII